MGIKGFKGFNPDMTCLGKQYEENTIFSEAEAVVCKKGMHFCVNPFDVLDYYPILNKECKFNVFAEVESLSEADTTDSCKFSTSEIKIGKKLNWKEFVESYLDIIQNDCPNKTELTSNDYAQIGSSGNGAQIGSSGDDAKIGSSGYGAQIGSSGDYAKIGSSGYNAQISSEGLHSVICCAGYGAKAQAKIGSWITLAEWKNNIPVCVKTEQVDGIKIKEDTWYTLKNGEFQEVENV